MSPRDYSTVNIGQELLALVRGAVRHVTRITGRNYSTAQFTRDAVIRQLQAIYRDYNDGKPIPPIPAEYDHTAPQRGAAGGGGEGQGYSP